MSAAVRVLIVDDDPLVRAGLQMMLDGVSGIAVVGEAADGDQIVQICASTRPDVILMDIRMPRVDGIAATRMIRARPDSPEVIVLTTFDSDDNIVHALRAGASGFLLKDTPPQQIVDAILRVAEGEPILSPRVTRRLIERISGNDAGQRQAQAALAALSEREREIVVAIGQGKSNAEIAAEFFLSLATVKAHVSHVLTKLDLTNRTQIAVLAHDAGLG